MAISDPLPKTGRLVRVKAGEQEFGWGAVVNLKRQKPEGEVGIGLFDFYHFSAPKTLAPMKNFPLLA